MYCNQGPKRFANPPKAPRVHKKSHPNIEAIFEKKYKVDVYARDVYTIEEQRSIGVLRSGVKSIDKALDNQLQPVHITIDDMVELYRNGIPFFLTKEEDSKTIFEAVTAHTGEWRNALRYAYNMGDSPVEDLILMEQFVASVYKHARFEFQKRPEFNAATGTLAAFLYSRAALGGTYSHNDVVNTAFTDERDQQNVKTLVHTPNVDVFQRALMQNFKVPE